MKKYNIYTITCVCVAAFFAAGNAAADELSDAVDKLLLNVKVVEASEDIADSAINNPSALKGKVDAQISAVKAVDGYGAQETDPRGQPDRGQDTEDKFVRSKDDIFGTALERRHGNAEGKGLAAAGFDWGFDVHGRGSFGDTDATKE